MKLYCCGCETYVEARLTNGAEIYPHRPDLSDKAIWKCDKCNNYVGCHNRTKTPLGSIPTKEIRAIRIQLHQLIDPIWRSGTLSRSEVYRIISEALGKPFHNGEVRTVEEARNIQRIVREELL